jgi:antitoxin ParD1/3/4
MTKNTSIILGDHFEEFIEAQIQAGRYSNVSEVVRSGLRLLEEQEQKVDALRQSLIEAEQSGDAGKLDFEVLKQVARARAGLPRDA